MAQKQADLPLSPAEILAESDAEIAEAEARAAEIAAAVEAGDDSVTLEQFEAAERQSRWARMRRAAAEKRAAARKQELAERQFDDLIGEVLPVAAEDIAPELDRLFGEARDRIEEALQLIRRRNVAVVQLARHGADPRTFKGRPDSPQLYGYVPAGQYGEAGAEFSLSGPVIKYMPSSRYIKAMFRPIKDLIAKTDFGPTDWWRELW